MPGCARPLRLPERRRGTPVSFTTATETPRDRCWAGLLGDLRTTKRTPRERRRSRVPDDTSGATKAQASWLINVYCPLGDPL